MCHALCLQPWITLAGNGVTIIQPHTEYADLAGYDAAAVYLEVANISNLTPTTTITLQTSPAKDEFFFINGPTAATYTFSAGATFGVQSLYLLTFEAGYDGDGWGFNSDTTVVSTLGRYLRWQVAFGSGATEMTFRIWLSLKQTGW